MGFKASLKAISVINRPQHIQYSRMGACFRYQELFNLHQQSTEIKQK